MGRRGAQGQGWWDERSFATRAVLLTPFGWFGMMSVLRLNQSLSWGQVMIPTALMLPFLVALTWAIDHQLFQGLDDKAPVRGTVVALTGLLAAGAVVYSLTLDPA